jgi:hypothetical protein
LLRRPCKFPDPTGYVPRRANGMGRYSPLLGSDSRFMPDLAAAYRIGQEESLQATGCAWLSPKQEKEPVHQKWWTVRAPSGGAQLTATLSSFRLSSPRVFALLLVHRVTSVTGRFTRTLECRSLKNTQEPLTRVPTQHYLVWGTP